MSIQTSTRVSIFASALSILMAASLLSSANSVPTTQNPALPNFANVDPNIYRGAAPTPAGIVELKKMGVQTVIDLRISPKHVAKEKAEVTALGMNFINLPMGSDPPTTKEEMALLATLSQAPEHPVYVHCEYGADRTGAMIGMYRRKVDHWDYARTYKEMRHFGFKPYLLNLAAFVKNSSPSP